MNSERRFKGKFTRNYDFVMSTFSYYPKFRSLTAKFLKDILNKEAKKIILEIGCGTGDLTEEILKTSKNIFVFALDIEPEMTSKARKKLNEYDKRLKLITSDALQYLKKQEDNSIDVVISSFTLHNFNRDYRSKVLKEIFRVLKKNGTFINTDKYALDDAAKDRDFFEKQIKKINTLLSSEEFSELREMLIKHEQEDIRPDYVMKEGEFTKQVTELGFSSIKKLFRENREAIIISEK